MVPLTSSGGGSALGYSNDWGSAASRGAHPLHLGTSLICNALSPAPLCPASRCPPLPCSLSQITKEDLAHAERALGDFGGDNRAGVEGTLHRISGKRMHPCSQLITPSQAAHYTQPAITPSSLTASQSQPGEGPACQAA